MKIVFDKIKSNKQKIKDAKKDNADILDLFIKNEEIRIWNEENFYVSSKTLGDISVDIN